MQNFASLQWVDLSVYNQLGEKIETLVSGKQAPGNYEVIWNAAGLPSGVYYCRMKGAADDVHTAKLLLMK